MCVNSKHALMATGQHHKTSAGDTRIRDPAVCTGRGNHCRSLLTFQTLRSLWGQRSFIPSGYRVPYR